MFLSMSFYKDKYSSRQKKLNVTCPLSMTLCSGFNIYFIFHFLSARFTEVMAQERSAGITPQPALCTPQLAVVPLKPLNEPDDPSVLYFPSCTRYCYYYYRSVCFKRLWYVFQNV